jgi:anion-transporting  ArsA/GET3 family ATPase
VCAGGGGVGKTTAAAALAVALARAGHRTLVVTVDPARRLANAMGVEIDAHVHLVRTDDPAHGKLFALMPEPRASTRTFVEILFEDRPDDLERMLDNRIYATLGDALSGIHDLVSLMLVARAVEEAEYDYLVIDTAPSRYALDFVSYPGRLAALFEGRAVSFFANLAKKAEDDDGGPPRDDKGLIAWGKKRVEAAIGRILDPRLLGDLAALFGLLALVRERFAELSRKSEALLLGDDSRYLLVAAPTGSADADLDYIVKKLKKLGQRPHAFLINRADDAVPSWLSTLSNATNGVTLPVQQAVATLVGEAEARKRSGDATTAAVKKKHARATVLRLPNVEARDPSHVVRALADRLSGELARLS